MGLKCTIKKQIKAFSIDVAFDCPAGKTLALIGPSGAGKTTIIRMLAGLERPDDGQIVYDGMAFYDRSRRVNISPQKRQLGYVFQDYTLFPHLTISENAAFSAKDRNEVDDLIDYFGLTELRNRKPHQVSGGERQRCAICQALATHPRLLLLDEPFSALDVETKRVLRAELKKIKEERAITVIYVTHDIHEAHYIGDIILPIVNGRVDRAWLERIVAQQAAVNGQAKVARVPKLALAY
ncbi:MAG: ATP-binding cassette domain-containing protein [Deltaproteobacteria bacterium]|nr:ATP-binding cassette domain-containing protein [Deltaproteobacteria bacterium]